MPTRKESRDPRLTARHRGRLRRLLDFHRREGLAGTAGALASRLFRLLYTEYEEILLGREFAGDETSAPDTLDLRLQAIDAANLAELDEFSARHARLGGVSTVTALDYLSCGYRGFLFARDDQTIGYVWWTDATVADERNHPALTRLALHLGAGDALLFDFFLDPAHRGDGIPVEVVNRARRQLCAMGYGRFFGYVAADNVGARVLWRILGYEELRRHTCRRVLSFFLLVDRKVFVKNGRWSRRHTFDYGMALRLPGSP